MQTPAHAQTGIGDDAVVEQGVSPGQSVGSRLAGGVYDAQHRLGRAYKRGATAGKSASRTSTGGPDL